MAKGNMSACLPITLAYEGGFTADRRDPGNWTGGAVGKGTLKGTKYGIAAASYPNLDISRLTLADVTPIYQRNYWRPLGAEALPAGLDLVTFDFGVNSGTARAAKTLQAVVGADVDGVIGAETLKKAAVSDVKKAIQSLCARRLGFLRGLTTWATFRGGWSKRVADVEARGVAMWLAASAHADPKAVLLEEAGKADAAAKKQRRSAGGSTVLATGGVGSNAALGGEVNWLLIVGVVAVVVIAGLLVMKARQNRERAAAYQALAKVS
ncbi:glycoside hydrolase family 108 protein [Rhizobium sp. BR 249]|uniref:glycoside hydrolase family 108 protein n=1 Tax=Rhizobium sp. BR 249 TaxID=3040011 RepID=UPI0039BF8A53